MTLHIVWQPTADAEPHTVGVPVFGVELALTLRGSVIIDASWQIEPMPQKRPCPIWRCRFGSIYWIRITVIYSSNC